MHANRKIIYFAGFIFTLPIALTSYINSSFLENYVNPYYISILYVIASLATIVGFFLLPRILTRFGNRVTTLWFSVCLTIVLVLLAFASSVYIIIPSFIIYFLLANLIIATLDIFIEDFSTSANQHHTLSSVGTFRGFYLTVINLAWVISQMISGSIINKSSYTGIYLLSAIFMILVSAIFFLFLESYIDPKYKKLPLRKIFHIFTHNKHLSKIYLLSFLLKFFFAWMVIYTPLYLHEYLALGWSQIGTIFTIMLLPFVFLSYPLGKLSDSFGEKKILKYGFLITGFATLLLPFVSTPSVILLALILFCTRIGAVMVEVMSESYFFKSVTEESADAISFFRNTTPVSYIIAPLMAIPLLYVLPSFKYLFFILGSIMLLGFLLARKLRDVK